MSRPVSAQINLAAIRHNLQRVRSLAPSSKVMSVIKADAYGHGLELVLPALNQSDGYAVAGINEAISIREAGVTSPVVLLSGFFSESDLPILAGYQLSPVVHSLWQVELLQKTALRMPVSVWLKYDSGMHRLGLDLKDTETAFRKLSDIDNLSVTGLMTHLANADDITDNTTASQLAGFTDIRPRVVVDNYSIANSAGITAWPDSHADWVRPGIMLYGSSPLIDKSAADLDLKPAMIFSSRLIAVAKRKAGERIGYGGDWKCEHDTTIGVIAAGYGDGYPRHAPPGTPVYVNGKRVPIAGRVSMDLITVDLGADSTAVAGDEAELWGNHVHVDEVALLCGTISYELLCQVTQRVPRIIREI